MAEDNDHAAGGNPALPSPAIPHNVVWGISQPAYVEMTWLQQWAMKQAAGWFSKGSSDHRASQRSRKWLIAVPLSGYIPTRAIVGLFPLDPTWLYSR